MTKPSILAIAAALVAGVTAFARQQPPATPPSAPAQQQQPSDVELVISGEGSRPPEYAVPDFVALSPDANDLGKLLGQVLWDDLRFEREVDVMPRDIVATVPVARTAEQVNFGAWRELNADAVVFGTVQKSGDTLTVQVRLFNARTRQAVFSREYSGKSDPRSFAHRIADEIHLQQRNLHGVAHTKLAFVSTRARTRVRGTGQQNRESKEVWIADYDGANQRQITLNSAWLNVAPSWSPDARSIAYTSYQKVAGGGAPDIFISLIYQGQRENPTKGRADSNFQPVFSPDGSRIAFMSNRDGNNEIYVMNKDGSGVRRLTFTPNASESTPTWSPTGGQIAFTSDRTGTPQIYIMSSLDGSGVTKVTSESYADRATWSPAPFNEIAYAARTGPGFDIKVINLSTREVIQLTHGEGSNESPAYSPNGRHIAFMSTRKGNAQIFTMTRDGRDLKQVTTSGTNETPAWSN